MEILILNGPNLNLLGKRNTGIYGTKSFSEYFMELEDLFPEIKLHYFQSNSEGAIIDKLHEVGFSFDGIIINPGAFTHYSYAIADAILAIETPVIEVHISNIMEREEFRKVSVTKAGCVKQIYGKGLLGYELSIKEILIHKE